MIDQVLRFELGRTRAEDFHDFFGRYFGFIGVIRQLFGIRFGERRYKSALDFDSIIAGETYSDALIREKNLDLATPITR